MKGSENAVKKLFAIYLGLILILSFGIMGYIKSQSQPEEEFPWDYMINLHRGQIIIVTDYGDTLTIHPDSLQTFIEQDNL
jgi:hypothetical protein